MSAKNTNTGTHVAMKSLNQDEMMEIVPNAQSRRNVDGMHCFNISCNPDALKETSKVVQGCTPLPSLKLNNKCAMLTMDWKTWDKSTETLWPHLM